MIIGCRKDENRIVISDDITIIPSKKEIQAVLLEILKSKNNSTSVISRNFCPTEKHLRILVEYLYLRACCSMKVIRISSDSCFGI